MTNMKGFGRYSLSVPITEICESTEGIGLSGRVNLTSLAAGQYLLHFEVEGFLPAERRVEVRTGQSVDLGDVVLNPSEGG